MNRLCSKQKYSTHYEGPFLADSRSLGSGFQRLLTRKLPLNLDESTAKTDPIETLTSGHVGI
jgi:hypothetical protein